MSVIQRALDDDARLKAQDPSAGLPQDELTALQREADRLAPMCTADASSLVLAEGLHLRVRNILTAAAERVGLMVIDHDVHDPAVCSSFSASAIAADLIEA
ncbi:MAG: hypothetical protein H7346_18390, partial [Burkholderiaceae bacterium]|nr:hypothetical protein [Burkholderiaceae bacterium]